MTSDRTGDHHDERDPILERQSPSHVEDHEHAGAPDATHRSSGRRSAHHSEQDHGDGVDPAHHHGFLSQILHVHHDHGPAIEPQLASDERGISALKVSIGGLLATALLQVVVVAMSGSVALLADTVHNFADALTSVPLWLAFVLGRRVANQRYTYGYGRAEDLAGVLIVGFILFSAAFAGYEAYQRLLNPLPIQHATWVMVAAVIGFVGNELVAQYRIRVGHEIGSAALVADGQHARVDGLTSLSVLISAAGAIAGYAIVDPIVGLVITAAILLVARNAAGLMWERLMDAVDPEIVRTIEETARSVSGVLGVDRVRVRWLGHRLQTNFCLRVDANLSTAASHAVAERVRHELFHTIPALTDVFVHLDPVSADGTDHHDTTAHHEGG